MTRIVSFEKAVLTVTLALAVGSAAAQEEILMITEGGSTRGYGTAVALAGDVDGDGFPDLVVGHAPAAHGSPFVADPGGFHVVSGKLGTDILSYVASDADEWMGASVAGLGDVSGDGVPDVLIGAPQTPVNGLGSGAVRVQSAISGAPSVFLAGAQPNDRFGWSVDAAGDVDGDGVVDLLIGAPGVSTGPNAAGAVYVRSGLDGSPLLTVLGTVPFAGLGTAVAGIGDVNADGRDDFAAGAPPEDGTGLNSGAVRVYSGLDGATLWTLHGAPFDSLGESLAGAGDVDLDGRPDVLAGLPGVSLGAAFSGAAHVLSGTSGAVLRTFSASVKSAGQGASVANAGDLDADGVPDAVVGSPSETTTDANAGAVRAWSGKDGTLLYTAYGEFPGEAFGDAVAGVTDLDLDGRPDVAVGRPRFPVAPFHDVGAVSVFSDCPGSFTRFGNSCQGTNGLAPLLNAQGCATGGGEVLVRLSVAPAHTTALLLVGPGVASTPIGHGCTLHVASPLPTATTFPTDGDGKAFLTVPIPASVGAGTVAAQGFVLDAGAPGGFTATNGITVTFE